MKEMSLHILDIAQNSISAGARLINLEINEEAEADMFAFAITDDGCGMSAEFTKKAASPFVTTRTERKLGLGLALLEQCCKQCGGRLELESRQGKGTRLYAQMEYNHIDRPPMGDIKNTVFLLALNNIDLDFVYRHSCNGRLYELDTRELKTALDGLPLDYQPIADWLMKNISMGIDKIYGVAGKE